MPIFGFPYIIGLNRLKGTKISAMSEISAFPHSTRMYKKILNKLQLISNISFPAKKNNLYNPEKFDFLPNKKTLFMGSFC